MNITQKKAQLIVTRHFYYNGSTEKNEFKSLRGDLQGAIAKEAEFQVKALAQTDGYSEILIPQDGKETTAEDKSQILFNAFCEYYAHIGNQELAASNGIKSHTFNKLLERHRRDTEEKSFTSPTQRKFILENNLDKTTRKARKNNDEIQRRQKQGEYFNAEENLQALMKHLKSFDK